MRSRLLKSKPNSSLFLKMGGFQWICTVNVVIFVLNLNFLFRQSNRLRNFSWAKKVNKRSTSMKEDASTFLVNLDPHPLKICHSSHKYVLYIQGGTILWRCMALQTAEVAIRAKEENDSKRTGLLIHWGYSLSNFAILYYIASWYNFCIT